MSNPIVSPAFRNASMKTKQAVYGLIYTSVEDAKSTARYCDNVTLQVALQVSEIGREISRVRMLKTELHQRAIGKRKQIVE
jgi:hypothetical protein